MALEYIGREQANYLATHIQELHRATAAEWAAILEGNTANVHPAERRRRRQRFERAVEAFELMWHGQA